MTLIKKINVQVIHIITFFSFIFFEKSAFAEIDCSDVNTTNVDQGDCEALVDFYYAMNGYNEDPDKSWKIYKNVNGTPQGWPWWNTLPIEKWAGVILNNATPRRVKSLYLSNMINIRGTIPESINNLTRLESFGVSGSPSFEPGSIYLPSNLNGLVSLSTIIFYNCNLSGVIYELLPAKLQVIIISSNKNLSGPIPSNLFTLPDLYSLDLSDNNLSGQLPTVDPLLPGSNLLFVDLSYNQFEGEIPSWIINKRTIIELFLNENKFSGKIPDINREAKFSNLKLDLSDNDLTELPSNVKDTKPIFFYAENNKLSGSIPSSYFEPILYQGLQSPKFETLALNDNQLTGSLPKEIFSPYNFFIENNMISGEVPYLLNTPFKPNESQYQNNNFTGVLNLAQVNGYQKFIDVSQNCLSRPKKEALNFIKPIYFFEQKPCGWQPKYWELEREPSKKGLKGRNKGKNDLHNDREFIRRSLKHSPNRIIDSDFSKEIERIKMQK